VVSLPRFLAHSALRHFGPPGALAHALTQSRPGLSTHVLNDCFKSSCFVFVFVAFLRVSVGLLNFVTETQQQQQQQHLEKHVLK
jgi:hypothetical protein